MTERLEIHGDNIDWTGSTEHLNNVDNLDTLPKQLLHNATLYPHEIAQREKDLGIWNSVTWHDYNEHVANIAVALQDFGVGPGDVVALIGDNRPEWVWSEIAAHAAGAMSMGIYRDALEDEIVYLMDYTKPKIVVAEDEEQVDKLLSLEDRVPSIVKIVYHDTRGMRKYDDPRLIYLDDLEAIGKNIRAEKTDHYQQMVAATKADDVAVLCTTSGTTSNPKLAMWKHGSILRHAFNYLRADAKSSDDEYLSMLPLSWVMEQMYAIAWNLIARMKVNFPEEQNTVMSDIREIGPSFILLSPRVWEVIAADIRARMMDSSKWKQWAYEWGVKRGTDAVEQGQKDTLADLFLFRSLRNQLGFSNLTSAATGGAAMGPDTFKFFQAMGVPLKQIYGQTEALGVYTVHSNQEIDYDTVGQAMPGCHVKIKNPDKEGLGEVLIKHPNLMTGYYQNENASSEAFDDNGCFMTGDAGYITPKGHLVVIDRVKDIAETCEGVRFSPQFIENKLKFSTYIAEAVILGDERPYLSAIICIRYPIVSKWAEQRRIGFTTYTDLSAREEIYDLIRKEVTSVNKSLPEAQRIQKFILLYKELDADDGELTRTKKIRRGIISEKYDDIIDSIYSDVEQVDIDTVISFQDGTSQRIVTTLKVEKLLTETIQPERKTA